MNKPQTDFRMNATGTTFQNPQINEKIVNNVTQPQCHILKCQKIDFISTLSQKAQNIYEEFNSKPDPNGILYIFKNGIIGFISLNILFSSLFNDISYSSFSHLC